MERRMVWEGRMGMWMWRGWRKDTQARRGSYEFDLEQPCGCYKPR
jgi:hypothetical protein